MKDYLINQLIQDANKKSLTPEIDFYYERNLLIESRKNKRATNKYFLEQSDAKLFLKIYSRMRKKIRHGNQFDVAIMLKKYFIQAEKDGLFEYIYQSDWNINPITGLYENDAGFIEKVIKQKREQQAKRCEFLLNIGFKPDSNQKVFNDIFVRYFQLATPATIVQMRKRLLKMTFF